MKKGEIWSIKRDKKGSQVQIKDGPLILTCIIPSTKDTSMIKKGQKCQYEGIGKDVVKLAINGITVWEDNNRNEENQIDTVQSNQDNRIKGTIKEFRINEGEAIISIKGHDNEYRAPLNQSQLSRLRTDQHCEFEVKTNKQGKTNNIIKLFIDGEDILEPANAPYNFIPVNDIVVKVSVPGDEVIRAKDTNDKEYHEIPSFDRYHKVLNTGYISLDIKALTPLYIRAANSQEKDKEIQEIKLICDSCEDGECSVCKYASKKTNPNFFAPAGIHRLPGSSLRGMIRNLVEIVSYSRMEFVDDRRFYYRRVADRSSRYQELMLDLNWEKGFNPKTKAGWLKETNGKYMIIPLEKPNIYRIEAYQKDKLWTSKIKDDKSKPIFENLSPFRFYEIYFIPAAEKKHMHGKKKNIPLRYALISDFQLDHDHSQDKEYEKGYLILSGSMGRKKHLHPVIHYPKANPEKSEMIPLNENIIKEYKEDINRQEDADLFKMLKRHPAGVPCFYLKDHQGKIQSIGHTPLFRLPYDCTVWDKIPAKHKDFEGINIVKAIFGDAEKYVGRVFFEDAKSEGIVKQYDELSPKILSTPKPTTVQHYLGQKKSDKLLDWNDTTNIRGYKLYWHRRTLDEPGEFSWRGIPSKVADNNVKTGVIYDKQHTVIKPVEAKTRFQGQIRFENLSNIELGALLFVLDLPDGCAHKIGMGKPLGLGSVCIKPTLTIIKRTDKIEGRYGRLFNEQGWHLAERQDSIDKFKACFAEYILKETKHNVSSDPINAYWDTERMQDLKTMLDFNNTNLEKWNIDTEYMKIIPKEKINDFTERHVLPNPQKVVASARKWSEGRKQINGR